MMMDSSILLDFDRNAVPNPGERDAGMICFSMTTRKLEERGNTNVGIAIIFATLYTS